MAFIRLVTFVAILAILAGAVFFFSPHIMRLVGALKVDTRPVTEDRLLR